MIKRSILLVVVVLLVAVQSQATTETRTYYGSKLIAPGQSDVVAKACPDLLVLGSPAYYVQGHYVDGSGQLWLSAYWWLLLSWCCNYEEYPIPNGWGVTIQNTSTWINMSATVKIDCEYTY